MCIQEIAAFLQSGAERFDPCQAFQKARAGTLCLPAQVMPPSDDLVSVVWELHDCVPLLWCMTNKDMTCSLVLLTFYLFLCDTLLFQL